MAENSETPVPYIVSPAIAYPTTTGMGGSPGIGRNPVNLARIGAPVVVTTAGASSVPDQPMAAVDLGDSSVPSQVQQFVAGHVDALTGDGAYIGQTGIGHGHTGHQA